MAAVFAVHPMHVESVAPVMGRKDLLSGLLYLAAALCWIRCTNGLGGRRAGLPDSIRVSSPGIYLAALGLFAAAMLSKSVAVTLPAAFAIMIWWKQEGMTWTAASQILPFFLIALCVALPDLLYYRSGQDFPLDYGFLEQVLIAARALWFYAGKLVWPTDLAVIYPLWDIDTADPLAWGYVIVAIAVAALLWVGRRRLGRAPLAGALLFAVTLLPTLGFVEHYYMQYSLVADRYAYLTGIGVMAVLIGAVVRGSRKLRNPFKIGIWSLLVAVLAVFGKLTWDQAGIYRDKISFYSHIVSLNPEALYIHRNLAIALIDAGRFAEALAASGIAVEQRPDSAAAHVSLGGARLALGRVDQAEESFRRALELDPDQKHAHYNMAEIRTGLARFAESIEWYRAALDVDPDFAPAHAGIGYALLGLERFEEAIASLARSVSLEPESPDAADRHVAMGRASLGLGRTEAAADSMERALAIDPRNAEALDSLALLRFRQQRYEEAVHLYEVLIETGKAGAQTHANVAATLYHLGRPEEALRSLERARALDPTLELARTGLEQSLDTSQRKQE